MTQPAAPLSPEPPVAGSADAGAFEARAEDVITFPDGLPGFETCRRFVVASYGDDQPFQCLQGLEASAPAFLTIDPVRALSSYRLILSPQDRVRLDVRDDDALLWLAIVLVAADGTKTVNLRAPIVINSRGMIGFQVMPHDSLYPLRQPLGI
jgi:flagellar assembly factor FliW